MPKGIRLFGALLLLSAVPAFAAPTSNGRLSLTFQPIVESITGKAEQPFMNPGKNGTVFFFIQHDCPICRTYTPTMNQIARKYQARGFKFYMVYVEQLLTLKQAQHHSKEYNFACPSLIDTRHELVKLAGATISPEVAVFSPDGTRLYLGRIDNDWAGLGIQRQKATKHDLVNVLNDIIHDKPIRHAVTQSVGCVIPSLLPSSQRNS